MCLVTNQEVEIAGSEMWVQRGGRKIAVKDMSDAHVRAAFSQLLKKIRVASNPAEDNLLVLSGDMVEVQIKRSDDSEGGNE